MVAEGVVVAGVVDIILAAAPALMGAAEMVLIPALIPVPVLTTTALAALPSKLVEAPPPPQVVVELILLTACCSDAGGAADDDVAVADAPVLLPVALVLVVVDEVSCSFSLANSLVMNMATPYFPFCMIIWAVNCEELLSVIGATVVVVVVASRRSLPPSSSSEPADDELAPLPPALPPLELCIVGISEDDDDSSILCGCMTVDQQVVASFTLTGDDDTHTLITVHK